jgi:hypothetical protein
VRDLSFDSLPGIVSDPLAAMRQAQKLDPLKGNRAVRVDDDGDLMAFKQQRVRVVA